MARGDQRQAAGRGRRQPVGGDENKPRGVVNDIQQCIVRTSTDSLERHMCLMRRTSRYSVPRLLELRRGSLIMAPPPAITSYVREASFENPLMLRDFDIDGPLLSSFVERWRLETHIFICRLEMPPSPYRMLRITLVSAPTTILLAAA
ncbi:hypothetical protein PIB30_086830 [Stylosanthes scabra]|uniref:Aminotransferase-like plant mobile domain-containing protein n=1 Tax=Stylosanthes scabra TaxID=79078 RepID=A0ABU6QUE4_9FABA|nr:hypothetical protein [Stylosanthes scabra]